MEILDFFAERSAGFLHGAGREGTRHLLSVLNLQGREKVLEVGVGTGATLVALKSIWPQLDITGVEASPNMLQRAQQRLRFCGLAEVSVHAILPDQMYPFADNSFDVVLVESVLAIQETGRLERMLTEIQRLLKPGGRLAMNETLWLPGQAPASLRAFNEQCRQHFGIIQSNDELPDVEAWKKLLVNKGWVIEYCERVEAQQGKIRFGWRNWLSELFSRWGRFRAPFRPQHSRQASWLKNTEAQLFAKGEQRLNAYLLVATKQ